MASVLETSVLAPLFTSGRTVAGSVAELVSLDVLVSLNPGVKEELVSVSIPVASEKLDVDV